MRLRFRQDISIIIRNERIILARDINGIGLCLQITITIRHGHREAVTARFSRIQRFDRRRIFGVSVSTRRRIQRQGSVSTF